MKKRNRRNQSDDPKSLLTRDLGYIWKAPPQPTPLSSVSNWQRDRDNLAEATVSALVQFEWRVAHMRERIEALGTDPHGRTRQGLAEQLTEAFLDQDRLHRAFEGLTEEDRQFYVNLLFQSRMQALQAVPDYQALRMRPSQRGTSVVPRILHAGLAISSEDGRLYIPFDVYAWLPPLSLDFPTVPEPELYTPAADPRTILAHIQQLLGLLQIETLTLRERPFWQPKEPPYAEPILCWPPTPVDAQVLQKHVDRERIIELFPPSPYLDDTSLKLWTGAINATDDDAEFLYHMMISLGLILSGSPITLDEARVHAWMALPPGAQLGAILRLFRQTTTWAAWWPAWRRHEIQIQHEYYGYWNLRSFGENVHRTVTSLRWLLLDVLSFLPDAGWLEVRNLVGWLVEIFSDATAHPYMGGLRPHRKDGDWGGFLHAALTALVSGPLYTLGFVDVSPSREDVQYIRLHGLSDIHWGRASEVPIVAETTLNPEVVCFFPEEEILEIVSPVPPGLTTTVLTWANPAGFSQNVVRYQLDVARLHTTFEAGEDADSLAAAWREGAGFDPPPEIVAWWQDWQSRYGRVRLYPDQTLLQTRDTFTMQELQISLPKLQSSMLGMITPAAALLKPDEADQVLSDLERQGYMPKEMT